jgi:hypothetical protein
MLSHVQCCKSNVQMTLCFLWFIGLALVGLGAPSPEGWHDVVMPELRAWTCSHKDCDTICVHRTKQVQRVVINGMPLYFSPGSRITLSGPCQEERRP